MSFLPNLSVLPFADPFLNRWSYWKFKFKKQNFSSSFSISQSSPHRCDPDPTRMHFVTVIMGYWFLLVIQRNLPSPLLSILICCISAHKFFCQRWQRHHTSKSNLCLSETQLRIIRQSARGWVIQNSCFVTYIVSAPF